MDIDVVEEALKSRKHIGAWIIRLVKGVITGIGAILPGLSGGVLAVVFGLYNPLIRFLAHPRENFWQNISFFLPVLLGVLLGVVAFSALVDLAFSTYAAQFIWLFVGFITGTFPSLYKTAGKQGRTARHGAVLSLTAALTLLFMRWWQTAAQISLPETFANWLLSGAMIGLGMVIPGMSPSNFLIYLGLYQPMARGISHLDFGVILPLALGLVACVLLSAKLVSWLFHHYYAAMYHLILGIVLGSTLAILPLDVRGAGLAASALLFAGGAGLSFWLSRLDEKHPHEAIL